VRDGAAIAAALGGRHNGKGWSFCCPCHDDRVPSASIRADGLITCFAGCPRADVLAALDALGFTDNGKTGIYQVDNIEARISTAQRKWEDPGVPPWFSNADRAEMEARSRASVEWYLRHRGITLPVPAVLRRWRNGFMAAVQQLDGVVTAIQTKSLGRKGITHGWLGSGAVQLAPPCDGELGLAEGVENALSATQFHGVPCWATLGARRLDAIDLPSGVRRVHLFPDNDEAGRAAAERAKRRYTNQLLPVRTWWPPDGLDWNDVLKGKQDAS
jgi:putative DNA primase/helicase